MGIQLSKYKNPADELLKLAHNVKLFGADTEHKFESIKDDWILKEDFSVDSTLYNADF